MRNNYERTVLVEGRCPSRDQLASMNGASANVRQRRAELKRLLRRGDLRLRDVVLPTKAGVALHPVDEVLHMSLFDLAGFALTPGRQDLLADLARADGIDLLQDVGDASRRDLCWLAATTDEPMWVVQLVRASLDARRKIDLGCPGIPRTPAAWVVPADDRRDGTPS